ncbi:hypothetical protein LX32DRAFT_93823 [Colletotrichum zoysiae]|uniref:Uncharacterized protein n=1 Tax=Colletotrichum zoysiae TaxID=1216348 RepID=A0AAD9HA64_9PEZI|nr:hypothetical protein LX32DRAFT_93823 [Colletotrichum zoysiae]
MTRKNAQPTNPIWPRGSLTFFVTCGCTWGVETRHRGCSPDRPAPVCGPGTSPTPLERSPKRTVNPLQPSVPATLHFKPPPTRVHRSWRACRPPSRSGTLKMPPHVDHVNIWRERRIVSWLLAIAGFYWSKTT